MYSKQEALIRRLVIVAVFAVFVAACGAGDALPSEWSRVFESPVLSGTGDQQMLAVVSTDTGLVAVGVDGSGGDRNAAVWTSNDGMAWGQVPHDEAIFGGPESGWMWDVATGPGGLVAVGFGGPNEAQYAAVWTSADGATWSRVPHDQSVFAADRGAAMLAVDSSLHGVVAVGVTGDPGGAMDAAVWTSPDGTTWSRVADADTLFGGSGHQSMSGVVGGPDRFVAVGQDNGAPAVWTSPDGTEWERVPDAAGVFDSLGVGYLTSITMGGPGYVAVGQGWADGPVPAVWTSPDGIIWARVPHDQAAFGGLGVPGINALTSGPAGMVAAGFDSYTDGVGDVALWSSPDGLEWSRIDTTGLARPHGQYAHGVTFYDGMVFVVGTDATIIGVGEVDEDAAVWVGE